MNIEGFPSEEFIRLVIDNKADQVTLVPDSPEALTSDHGWDFEKHEDLLRAIVPVFKDAGIRVSLFVDPQPDNADKAQAVGADRIELYTGPYAHRFERDGNGGVQAHTDTSRRALNIGLGGQCRS